MSQYVLEPLKRIVQSKPQFEKRCTVFGMAGSGKTTALGLLKLTAADLTQPTNPKGKNFYSMVEEKSSGIRQCVADLCAGKFPPPTPLGNVFEAHFLLKWKEPFGEQSLRLPWCETAGEEMEKLITRFSEGQYDITERDFQHAGAIHEYVLRSNGVIVVLPTPRAAIKDGKGIEPETSQCEYADVNLSRLLQCICTYKRDVGGPPIQGLGVILSKYDSMATFLCEQGMNLTDPVGVQNFMSIYFRQTNEAIKWFTGAGLKNVRFFPSWVTLARDKDNNLIQNDRGYQIKTIPGRNIPEYSYGSYEAMIDWLKQTFPS